MANCMICGDSADKPYLLTFLYPDEGTPPPAREYKAVLCQDQACKEAAQSSDHNLQAQTRAKKKGISEEQARGELSKQYVNMRLEARPSQDDEPSGPVL